MALLTATKAPTTTAEDTLKAKSRDAQVVSGGHLVAKALKNEGVDTIFMLCGGHIIDIYDGCIDEGIGIVGEARGGGGARSRLGIRRSRGTSRQRVGAEWRPRFFDRRVAP